MVGGATFASLKCCFAAGTPVSTPQGLRPIASIRPDIEVWAYDLVARTWVPRKVLQTFSSEYEGAVVHIRVDGEILTSTARHPFWVVRGERLWERSSLEHLPKAPEGTTKEGAWVDACDMDEGDELLLQGGRVAHVQSLSTVKTAIPVYNFEVAEHHDYSIGTVRCLVHNTYTGNITTPSTKLQQWAQQGGYVNPRTNKWIKFDGNLAADHVYPKDLIKKLDGYESLNPKQQEFLLNFPGNFEPFAEVVEFIEVESTRG